MRDFESFIFSNPSYFCMWNKVSGNKAHLVLFTGTKFTCNNVILAEIQISKDTQFAIYQLYSTNLQPALRVLNGLQLYCGLILVFPLTYFPILISGPDITLSKTAVSTENYSSYYLYGKFILNIRCCLREGPCPRGAPSVPPLSASFPEKRLELKSLKGQTKAEEEGPGGPFLLSLRPGESLLQFLVGIFSQNFTLQVSRVQLLKYEHPHIQNTVVTIIVLMFEFC